MFIKTKIYCNKIGYGTKTRLKLVKKIASLAVATCCSKHSAALPPPSLAEHATTNNFLFSHDVLLLFRLVVPALLVLLLFDLFFFPPSVERFLKSEPVALVPFDTFHLFLLQRVWSPVASLRSQKKCGAHPFKLLVSLVLRCLLLSLNILTIKNLGSGVFGSQRNV